MLVLGSALPIIIIKSHDTVAAWKVGTLELIAFGGLVLLMAQLALKIRLPLRIYAGGSIIGLLVIGLTG